MCWNLDSEKHRNRRRQKRNKDCVCWECVNMGVAKDLEVPRICVGVLVRDLEEQEVAVRE